MRGRLGRPSSRSALLLGAELASSDRRRRRIVLSSEDSRLWCLPPVLTLSHQHKHHRHDMPSRNGKVSN